jgi:hypothetical protein
LGRPGPNWAVEPYDDDSMYLITEYLGWINYYTVSFREMCAGTTGSVFLEQAVIICYFNGGSCVGKWYGAINHGIKWDGRMWELDRLANVINEIMINTGEETSRIERNSEFTLRRHLFPV